MNESKPSNEVQRILREGALLERTEALALRLSNHYDFTRRMIQEISLIIAGQTIKYLNIGFNDRAFSHGAIYSTHGFGRDTSWKIASELGLFPFDIIRATRLDSITHASLSGTITEYQIVPPPTISNEIIFVGEYETLKSGPNANQLAADFRALLETGKYTRRLAKVSKLKEVTQNPFDIRRKILIDELEKYRTQGMDINVDTGEIAVTASTSWLISSARFGSESHYTKPLLSLGDIDRYRWRSYLPDKEERLKIVSEVGSIPPISIDPTEIQTVNEAWRITIAALRKLASEPIEVHRDEESYFASARVIFLM